MMFSLFETFIAVYETKSFTRAAEQLFFSQPTITVRIKKLEDELGFPLFLRGQNLEIIPTTEAQQFYPKALKMLKDWSQMQSDLRQTSQGRRSFKIAASHSTATSVITDIFRLMLPEIAQLNLEISSFNSEKVFDLVSRHEIHFGLIEKPMRDSQTQTFPLFQDELVLAGNLSSDIFFIRETGSGVNHYTEMYLKEQSNSPKNLIKMDSNDMIVTHIKAGLGASLISKRFISGDMPYLELGEKYQRLFYGVSYLDEYDETVKSLIKRIKEMAEIQI